MGNNSHLPQIYTCDAPKKIAKLTEIAKIVFYQFFVSIVELIKIVNRKTMPSLS